MGTLANSKDPDEMLHNAAFHQCLYCLLSIIELRETQYILEIITCVS